MFPAKMVVAFTACCIGAALHAQEEFIGPVVPPTVPNSASTAASALSTAIKPAEPKAPSMLESFKKTAFSRTPVTSLREWAGLPPEVPGAAPAAVNAANIAAAALAAAAANQASAGTPTIATTATATA